MPKIHQKFAPARIPRRFGRLLTVAAALLAACEAPVVPGPAAESSDPVLRCGSAGHLSATLYGAIETALDWDKTQLECTGMPRPEGNGARLRLAGIGSENLVFIIAIPGLEPETQHAELGVNLTLIEEGKGRFFSTPDLGNCLVDLRSAAPVDESTARYSITGTVYCVDPLPEVNGDSSVSIPELHFSGLLDWSGS